MSKRVSRNLGPGEPCDGFPDRLRLVIKKRNMTYRSLGIALGVNNAAISHWCNGYSYPSYATLWNLCNVLNVCPKWLMYARAEGYSK